MQSHLRITQAAATSALTFLVGQLAAFIPSISNDQQNLISAGSAAIAAVFLVANAVHHLADSNVSAKDVEAGAIVAAQDAARAELGRVDLNALASQAVAGHVPDPAALLTRAEEAARAEVSRILAGLAQTSAPVPPSAPAPGVAA